MIKVYKVKINKFSATNYNEAYKKARDFYKKVKVSKRTKKSPSVKAVYFKNEKIFLDEFWKHLGQKNGKTECVDYNFLLVELS